MTVMHMMSGYKLLTTNKKKTPWVSAYYCPTVAIEMLHNSTHYVYEPY